jgi:hypothetical protein
VRDLPLERRQGRDWHGNGGRSDYDPADPKMPLVRLKAGKRLKREKPLAEMREAASSRARCSFASSGCRWCR